MITQTRIRIPENICSGICLVAYQDIKSGVTRCHFVLRTDFIGNTPIKSAAVWINNQAEIGPCGDEHVLLSTGKMKPKAARQKALSLGVAIAELSGLCALTHPSISHVRILFSDHNEKDFCVGSGWRPVQYIICPQPNKPHN
jgi:hypothetical protein